MTGTGMLARFIVFEGIDGSGRSTQMRLLKDRFEKEETDRPTLFSFEPTDGPVGRFLRSALAGDPVLEEGVLSYLFAADRRQHIYGEGGVMETIEAGGIAFSDRYIFSSLVYQGITCGKELPRLLNAAFPLPELLFFFEIDADTALKRIASRSAKDMYENRAFLESAARAYNELISEYEKESAGTGMTIVRIDAGAGENEISNHIWNVLSDLPILKYDTH